MSTVRVRFAPSPTGPLHIGGLRTALFNYLYAKKHNGTFVLRIEDTDQNRFVEGAEEYIKESLEWCKIPYDEGPGKEGNFGPYKQSERKHLYKEYVNQLIEKGMAYYAFDTTESLDTLRKEYEAEKKTFIYNWENRGKLDNSISLTKEATQAKLDAGEKYVVRFKIPTGESLEMFDEVRGKVVINTDLLDDKVLYKSDGMPTYHLANIVDDHLMEITHVIRGEEWLPSLALHTLLYRAFEWEAPKFAHLSLILKPVGKGKLSKRDGDKMGFPVFPLEWKDPKTGDVSTGYREEGFYPETVVNFLSLLGWNSGTEQEIFSLEELTQIFDLSKVNKSGAKFDPEKNKWFQQQYLQQRDTNLISKEFKNLLSYKGIETSLPIETIVESLKERAVFVDDLWNLGKFFFEAPTTYDTKASKKAWKDGTSDLMNELVDVITSIDDFSSANVTLIIKEWITSKEIGFGKIMMPLRLALVGSLMGPDVYEIAALLGKEATIFRVKNAIANLS